MVGALLSSGDESMEGILIGIDPAARAAVYPALDAARGPALRGGREGRPAEPRAWPAGWAWAWATTVVALGNTADGRMSAVRLKVTGIWWVKGLEAYEWGACYADLAAVQELLDAPDQAGVLVLRQRDPRAPVGAHRRRAQRRVRARAASRPRRYTWEEMGGPFIGGMTAHALRGEHHGHGDDA